MNNPTDINFATECVNSILGGLNPQWKNVSFKLEGKGEQEID